ncbi:MAG TPA: polysaccharide biosynthesis C-terminal domain-containing protein, partial [Novosphingobium sp.]|nr:polysaccharide biosynthesis C-terminal domain-containing protein [Novosphingobium sp.]
GATAVSATLNCLLLYAILHRRGWFHFTWKLAGKIARQLIASAVMAALLAWLMPVLTPHFAGNWHERVWSLALLVGAGLATFFAVAFLTGAVDKSVLAQLRRRRSARTAADDEILEVE